MIREKFVDAVVPPPSRVFDLIVREEAHKKLVWTAGRVLKEAALWKQVEELEYDERKIVLNRVTGFLEDFASQGILRRRTEPQSIGYGTRLDSTTLLRGRGFECNRLLSPVVHALNVRYVSILSELYLSQTFARPFTREAHFRRPVSVPLGRT